MPKTKINESLIDFLVKVFAPKADTIINSQDIEKMFPKEVAELKKNIKNATEVISKLETRINTNPDDKAFYDWFKKKYS